MAILGKERFHDLEMIYEGISGIRDLYENDPASRGLLAYMKAFTTYAENISRMFDDDKPVVWHNCGLSPELILGLENAYDLPIESYPVLEDIVGDPNITCEHIDLAEAHGLPWEVCSVDKAALGSALKGLLPPPACLLGVNTPCDSQVAAVQTMAEIAGTPIYLIDIPYLYGKREVQYVARQLRDAIPFLEKHTGRKWNPDLFKTACQRSNRMSESLLEWNELRKHVPCPQVSKVVGLMIPLFIAFAGTETGVYVAEQLALEARERIARGEAAVEGERIRVVWFQDPIWFDLQFYDWLESEFKLVVAMDLFGYHAPEGKVDLASVDTMLEGLASRIIRLTPMTRQFKGPIDIYLNDFAHLCSEYKANMAVYAGHVACKHGWGGIGFLKEKAKEIGVPLLVFEFDMFDPRVTTVESLQEEFTRFVNNVVLPRLK
jgi:benzoyl-CoA reductase/2-hydroxyglutaryl-CoA dehydratase subunit BcrC/BadD/HgdB